MLTLQDLKITTSREVPSIVWASLTEYNLSCAAVSFKYDILTACDAMNHDGNQLFMYA